MTVTTHVKARAHGAFVTLANIAEGEVGHVTTDHQEIVLAGWEERQFHLEDGQQLTVKQGTPKMMEDLAAAAEPELVKDPAEVLTPAAAEEIVLVPDDEKVADDAGKSRSGRR